MLHTRITMDNRFKDIINLIRTSRNTALISEEVTQSDWGKSVVSEPAEYIQKTKSNIKGFSDKNLWRMEQFYEAYKDTPKLSTPLRETKKEILNTFRDSYVFDFLNLKEAHNESDLQKELVNQMKEFILELGKGV